LPPIWIDGEGIHAALSLSPIQNDGHFWNITKAPSQIVVEVPLIATNDEQTLHGSPPREKVSEQRGGGTF
jgi:hypothetical protein